MFSFAFSRFYLCYLPWDSAKMAHPHPHHCYKHLVEWIMDQDNTKTGQQGRDRGGQRGKDNDGGQHPTAMSSCSQCLVLSTGNLWVTRPLPTPIPAWNLYPHSRVWVWLLAGSRYGRFFSFFTYMSPVLYLLVSALRWVPQTFYLLIYCTNILILLRGKQCPEGRGACGSSILYTGWFLLLIGSSKQTWMQRVVYWSQTVINVNQHIICCFHKLPFLRGVTSP